MRGNQGCLQCHGEIARDVRAHTHHDPAGRGSDCYACHMPPITYGLLAIHPTHRIQNPEPARAWRNEMPEACTVCHTNQTAPWAAEQMSRQYGLPLPSDVPTEERFRTAESVRTLMAGDVVQRAVAVNALSEEAGAYTSDPMARLWAVPFLLMTLEDGYPAVRHFAYRGLRHLCDRAALMDPAIARVASLPAFDYLAEPAVRKAAVDAWWAWWRGLDKRRIPHPGVAVPLDAELQPIPERVAALTQNRDQQVIAIGE
jgi:hypothetical protein